MNAFSRSAHRLRAGSRPRPVASSALRAGRRISAPRYRSAASTDGHEASRGQALRPGSAAAAFAVARPITALATGALVRTSSCASASPGKRTRGQVERSDRTAERRSATLRWDVLPADGRASIADGRIGRRSGCATSRVLFGVMRRRQYDEAGAHLGMSQSAVSQAIAALEHALGMPMLDRAPRGSNSRCPAPR